MEVINIQNKLKLFSKQWHPHRVAMVDNMQVILAKIKGEFVWYSHENEDELFKVVKGSLYMQFRDRTEGVKEGEMIVVPKGVEHHPMTKNDEEVHLLLFEKLETSHIGEVQNKMTQTVYPWL